VRAGELVDGRYRIEYPLGGGGMALVYRARDEQRGRQVAVKVLAENLNEDRDLRKRFIREAQIAARLSHPNIVEVYDSGHDGRPYIVMEYIAGPTLGEELGRRGPLPIGEAAELIAQAADGLAHAHSAGIVHRDVKPGNLLLRPDGGLKITDFGIAHALDATRLTQAGAVLGTAAYLAPEQASGSDVTPASDVYALGAVLYELLTGAPPYVAASFIEIVMRKLDGPPQPPSALDPRVTRDLDIAVARCLDADPSRRPTAAGLRDALRSRSEAMTKIVVPASLAPTRRLSRPRKVRSSWLALLAAVLVGAGALGLVAWFGGGSGSGSRTPLRPVRVVPVQPGPTPADEARKLAQWIRRYSG
jgi:serine/threonine protein kinase